jgi:hypothetical protein
MGVSAAAHGKRLLELGFTVDQEVHDYGDLAKPSPTLRLNATRPSPSMNFAR